ncbi:MAG: multidrug effflux MFS transporter [Rhodoferax sp.]|nr:multidrug effflux MFS transporter [Rhodoferax sp.]
MTAAADTRLRPGQRALVANLIGQLALGLLAMTLCLPSMPSWGGVFQAGPAAVQLTFSAFVVANGCLQIVFGPLSDRLGRKPVLLFGLLLSALGAGVAALAPSLDGLIAGRVLQGMGAAAGMVVGRAMAQDLFQGPIRTRVMAYIGMAMGLCPPLATLLGGQIHVHLGWRYNFGLTLLLAVLLFVAAWRGLPAPVPRPPSGQHWLRDLVNAYRRLAGQRVFLLYLVVLACTSATFLTFLGGAPLVLSHYGVGPADIGWYVMCVPTAYILGNFLTSHLVHRLGERRVMVWGEGITLASLGIVLGFSLAGVHTPLALALPLVLMGIGHGLLMPPAIAGSVGVLPALAGSAVALSGLAQQLTGAFGGYLVGLLPHDGALHLTLVMGGFTLTAGLAVAALGRGRR